MAKEVRLTAIGTRGDVQPYIALGLGLQAAGYRTSLITTADFADLVEGYGLEVRTLPFVLRDALATREAGGASRRARRALFEAMLRSLAPLCQGADLFISSPISSLLICDIAEYLDVAAVPAFLQPFAHPTREFPASTMPRLPFASRSNRLSYVLLDRLSWLALRGRINRWRRDQLGLPPATASSLQRIQQAATPALYGISPTVLPRPADWKPSVHLTGYWFLPVRPDYQPPPALAAFLADGPPPVAVGFGSMGGYAHQAMMREVVTALTSLGVRAVVSSGWGTVPTETLPPAIFALAEDVPHDWLFPRIAAVVHHGGAGTTAASLRAGKPTIVVPTGGDQRFWGERVAALGAGPPPIPRDALTAPALQQAIARALADTAMQDAAARVGEAIRQEDGVATAVGILRGFMPP